MPRLCERRAFARPLGSETFPAVGAEPDVHDEEPVRFLSFELGPLRRMPFMRPSLPLSIRESDGTVDVALSPDMRAELTHDLAN